MAAAIRTKFVEQPDEYTLSDDYKAYIESLVPMLRAREDTVRLDLDPEKGYLYRFDLTSFLLDNHVALEDHLLIMRVNGLTSAHEIDEYTTSLLIPDQSLIAQLKQIYRTRLDVQ